VYFTFIFLCSICSFFRSFVCWCSCRQCARCWTAKTVWFHNWDALRTPEVGVVMRSPRSRGWRARPWWAGQQACREAVHKAARSPSRPAPDSRGRERRQSNDGGTLCRHHRRRRFLLRFRSSRQRVRPMRVDCVWIEPLRVPVAYGWLPPNQRFRPPAVHAWVQRPRKLAADRAMTRRWV